MALPVAIPPAYEGTGYRRFLGQDGTPFPGRAAMELPAELSIVDELATSTRPARSRLFFTGIPGGGVPLTFVISATSPIRINGGASANFTAPITLSILPATGANAGSFSIADFNKLAGIEAGAINATAGAGLARTGSQLRVDPHLDGSILATSLGTQVGVLATNAQHGPKGGGSLHSAVTSVENGFMLATDKVKFDALATAAYLGAGDVAGTTTTRYLNPGYTTGTAGITVVETVVVRPFSVSLLKLIFAGTGAAGATITYQLRKNGVPQTGALIAVASNAAANTVYTSSAFTTVTFAVNDLWSFQITKDAGVASGHTLVMLTMQQLFL